MRAWCPEDMVEVLQAHTHTHHQLSWEDEVYMDIGYNSLLWGEPPASCWSQQAWTSLLQLVPHHRGRDRRLQIWVTDTAPLRGLMACLSPTQLSEGGGIVVGCGEASLEEVEDWVDRWQAARGLRLSYTHIVLPGGVSEASLKARRDRLREVRDVRGEKMVYDPAWRTETGERYTWSDGGRWILREGPDYGGWTPILIGTMTCGVTQQRAARCAFIVCFTTQKLTFIILNVVVCFCFNGFIYDWTYFKQTMSGLPHHPAGVGNLSVAQQCDRQVEATTGKQAVVIRGNGLFSQDT